MSKCRRARHPESDGLVTKPDLTYLMLYGRPDESCYKPSVCAVGGALVYVTTNMLNLNQTLETGIDGH